MRKHNHIFSMRLTKNEYDHLCKNTEIYGGNKQNFIRSLIKLEYPSPCPTDNEFQTIRELRYIGNNINQIARVANTNGDIQYEELSNYCNQLDTIILDIYKTISRPTQIVLKERNDNGIQKSN